jgi:anthranilate phosphoribosyltransferase
MLRALNIPIPTTLEEAHATLKETGWVYVDQSVSFPELHALTTLRTNMVKRPVLATIEKFLHPIQSQQRHILVTGYTHPAYKDMTSKLLSDANKAHEFIFFRGTEGAAQLSLDRRAPFVKSVNGVLSDGFVSPEDIGLTTCSKIEPEPDLTIAESLKRIQSALTEMSGIIYDTLLYNVTILSQLVDASIEHGKIAKAIHESKLRFF